MGSLTKFWQLIVGLKLLLPIWLLMLLLSLNTAHATSICTPTMTPEQAYLAVTGKQPSPQTTNQSQATTLSLPKLININTASEAELTQLDGIGAKKAQDIILYREMIAPFASIDDLAKVKGIGQATVNKNRSKITVR